MKALKFTLSGKTAFFKQPDVNEFVYFTFGSIHKVALLGILGAVIGYKGYNLQKDFHSKKFNNYPQFYEKLNKLNFSIKINNEKALINRKIQVFNNSIGYASKEEGGNLIIKEQWLENPSWDILILSDDSEEYNKIKEYLLNSKCIYIPYLGKNDHFANLNNIEETEMKIPQNINKISSLFPEKNFIIEPSYDINVYKYEEELPISLDENTNQYIKENMIQTNSEIKMKNKNNQKNIYEFNNNLYYFI